MDQTKGHKKDVSRKPRPRSTSCVGHASWCLRFVGLAVAFGESAWRAAVRWWLVRAAVESFGVAAFAELLLWRVSAGQSCGSFLGGGLVVKRGSLNSIVPVSTRILPDLFGEIQQVTRLGAANRRNDQTSSGAGTGVVTGVGVRCGTVITRITAVRMTVAARIVRKVMVSLAISHPRNKATTGFTNA
jgi:hypothetical protein